MEANLLPYLAARVIQYAGRRRSNFAMATLLTPSIAVSTGDAFSPSGLIPRDRQVITLEFPHRSSASPIDGELVYYNDAANYAVIKLDAALEIPAEELFTIDPPERGAKWEALCFVASAPDGAPASGYIDGVETSGNRTLIRLSVKEEPLDSTGASGAPVIVNGKIIGIVWGNEYQPGSPETTFPKETWYAVPLAAMLDNDPANPLRDILGPLIEKSTVQSAQNEAARPSELDAMLKQLGDISSFVRLAAIEALKYRVNDTQVRPAVAKLLLDPNKEVRATAISALAVTLGDDPELRSAIIASLNDRGRDVRLAAVEALSPFAATDDHVRAALTARFNDTSNTVRAAAVKALGGLTDDSTDAIDEVPVLSSPPASDEDFPETATAEPLPDSPELDRISFFGRLNQSARRAIYHAVGMRLYFHNSLIEKAGPSESDRDVLRGNPTPLPLEYLIAGLFENEYGPTRKIFRSKDIDDGRLAALMKQSADLPLPSRTEYQPLRLTFVPDSTPETTLAFRAARDIADANGATQIRSRHLLHGALSVKGNALVRLLAEAGVTQADVPLTDAEPARVPRSIAFVSADTAAGQDLLGFEADVNALSAIIAAKTVEPPISIGLFGDWGSGKSFFMGKMDECIKGLTEIDRATGGKSAYCSNIVQIWFNAWSYVEADLWASLVTDIFEELARSIEKDARLSGDASPATAKARLLASMASARDVVAEEERRRDAARNELKAVEEHVATLKFTDEQIQNKLGSKELLKDAYRVVSRDPAVKARIDDAAEKLSIPEAQRAAGEVRASLLEIKGLWSALGFALKGWKSLRAWLLAAAVLVAVFGLTYFLIPLVLKVDIGSTISKAAGLVISAVAFTMTWLAPFLKKAMAGLSIIKDIKQQQQQRIDDERAKIEDEAKKQRAAVRQKLDQAEIRVESAKAELDRLDQTLKEMRADKQLLNFIRERSLSTDYTTRLGTVAKARRDFRQLSDLMDRVRTQSEDGPVILGEGQTALALPRIDRIVLYIDDLDRCAEDRVVKVLEAVHLLLAFRLFVVIVAVDSRWLLRSLRQHSTAFQTSSDAGTGISDEELAHWESTPLNYLEKIFQIPFYLRPMRKTGFERLVDSVVGNVVAKMPATSEIEVPAVVTDERPGTSDKPAGATPVAAFKETKSAKETEQIVSTAKEAIGVVDTTGTTAEKPAIIDESVSTAEKTSHDAEDKAREAQAGDANRAAAAQQVAGETVKPETTTTVESEPSVAGLAVGAAAGGATVQGVGAAVAGAKAASGGGQQVTSHQQTSAPSPEEVNPAALQLGEWERDFMKVLHPLVTSPRSTKRFVNIYRLMRVSITNQKELGAFVGDRNGGEHRAALLLLAILTGYPAEATDILRDLLETERSETWWQFIDSQEDAWNKAEQENKIARQNKAAKQQADRQNEDSEPLPGPGTLSARRRKELMAKLRLLRREIPETQSCDHFVKWASRVAKYSFESGRVLMLLNDEVDAD